MPTDYRASLRTARRDLQAASALLQEEIAAYPTPISGCDAQFNHLLVQRRRIRAALGALEAEHFVATPRQPAPESRVESR